MASTLTTVLSLFKPTPGTKEPFRTSDVNSNWDKLDAAIGRKVTKATVNTVVNSTSEALLLDSGTYTIAANTPTVNQVHKMVIFGTFGNVVTATPTITFRLRLGGLAGTQLGASIVVTTNAAAQTNQAWRAEVELVYVTLGATGTVNASFKLDINLGNATVVSTSHLTTTSSPVTIDTTADKDLTLTAQWSAANAANTISGRSGYAYRVTNS